METTPRWINKNKRTATTSPTSARRERILHINKRNWLGHVRPGRDENDEFCMQYGWKTVSQFIQFGANSMPYFWANGDHKKPGHYEQPVFHNPSYVRTKDKQVLSITYWIIDKKSGDHRAAGFKQYHFSIYISRPKFRMCRPMNTLPSTHLIKRLEEYKIQPTKREAGFDSPMYTSCIAANVHFPMFWLSI